MRKSNNLLENSQDYCKQLIPIFNQSVTPFHFVDWARKHLDAHGFSQLLEKDIWSLTQGGKYYMTRNNSSIVVLTIGGRADPSTACFKIIGGHTDSPTLRVAPNSHIPTDKTFDRLNLHLYGGGQWQTWFDRDLSIAGKVVVIDPESKRLETRLVDLVDPVAFIPNLCIHLRKDKENFAWNNEQHLKAVLSTTFFDDSRENCELTSIEKSLGVKLAKAISNRLSVPLENIMDYNLILYDTQKTNFIGLDKEFLASARFDNHGTAITSVLSFIEASAKQAASDAISVCALFDSEEVGSLTYQGAYSAFFKDTLRRVFLSLGGDVDERSFQAACSRSLIVSSDMAHLYHPNYPEYYQAEHSPKPHGGVVLKVNPNAKYSSEAEGSSLVKYIAKQRQIPFQEFIVRQDLPCGTTIGPIIAGTCGMRSVDIGAPQLAMHSIRESVSCVDLFYLGKFFEAFLELYENSKGGLFEK